MRTITARRRHRFVTLRSPFPALVALLLLALVGGTTVAPAPVAAATRQRRDL